MKIAFAGPYDIVFPFKSLGAEIINTEDRNIEEPKGDPIGVLKYLLEEHGLKQSDLQEIGSQGVVSEILKMLIIKMADWPFYSEI
ncbi:MAG: hypothetical protein P8Y30_05365 [candidate division WOR-3 bacterium]